MSSNYSEQLFNEIISRYSSELHPVLGEVFIKHPSHQESLMIERQYNYFYHKAIEKNLPLAADKEKSIISEGLWSKHEEESLKNNTTFIQGLRDNLSKEFLLSKRKMWKRELSGAEHRINSLLIKKDYFIGTTAEKYAREQSFHYQIVNSFYKDDSLTEKLKLDDTSISEYEELVKIYRIHKEKISSDNIKRIAISPSFTNIFYMSGDNAYYFYGCPVVNLTIYQTSLYMWGSYFKNLMSRYGDRLPKEMLEETEDIIEWFEITQNVEKSGILKADEDQDGGAMSVVGATKKDLEMMGIDPNRVVNLSAEMAKRGKTTLTKEDLFEMSG